MPVSVSPEVRKLARKIAASEKSDVYIYNGPINEDGVGAIIETIDRQHPSAILLLTTFGGSANAAYRIARWFQASYEKFGVFVISYCKSAGTLIVVGANRLIMADAIGELGPLDVQLSKRDELWEQRSGLVLRAALNSLSEAADELFGNLMLAVKRKSRGSVRLKFASDLAKELTQGLLAPIYSQITPESLGEDHQELQVAHEYGKRLANLGGNISEAGIKALVHSYPSHDFVIDRPEAETLFFNVDRPTVDMFELARDLQALCFVPDSSEVTVVHLSKPEKQETDEAEGKNSPDAQAEAKNGGIDDGKKDAPGSSKPTAA